MMTSNVTDTCPTHRSSLQCQTTASLLLQSVLQLIQTINNLRGTTELICFEYGIFFYLPYSRIVNMSRRWTYRRTSFQSGLLEKEYVLALYFNMLGHEKRHYPADANTRLTVARTRSLDVCCRIQAKELCVPLCGDRDDGANGCSSWLVSTDMTSRRKSNQSRILWI